MIPVPAPAGVRVPARPAARTDTSGTAAAMPDLFAPLTAETGRYHEVFTASGAVRAHWERFHDLLSGLSPDQMQQRVELVERLVQETASRTTSTAPPRTPAVRGGWARCPT